MSTTHVDKHGDRMSIGALKSGAKLINSPRKPKLTINHDQTLPPSGVVTEAWVEKRTDGFHQLVATQRMYKNQKLVRMPDGSPGILEYFEDMKFVFSEIDYKESDVYELNIDIHCFESSRDIDDFIASVREHSLVEFKVGHYFRKSFLNDPELAFTLCSKVAHAFLDSPYKTAIGVATGSIGVATGVLAKKALEKVADKVADDFASVYTWLKNSMVEGAKRMLPKNKRITYILRVPGIINIELIIRTSDVTEALMAITADKIAQCKSVIDLMSQTNAAKITLLYSLETKLWEFAFMLSRDGQTLSSPKAIAARNKAYVDLGKFVDAKVADALKIHDGSIPTEVALSEDVATTAPLPS
jgi:hypothetical protein